MTGISFTRRLTETGAKGRQRDDHEDRAAGYRRFRMNYGASGLCCADLDQVEWRMIDGMPTPVAVLPFRGPWVK